MVTLRGALGLNWFKRILLLGALVTLAVTFSNLPGIFAQPPCTVQSINYQFPSTVATGQQITVTTHLVATCVQWAPYWTEYSIRVDLTNISTGYVLSTTAYQVGYAQTYIDQVFLNSGTAPNFQGNWMLRVDVYIWGGEGQLLVHLTNYAKLPVT